MHLHSHACIETLTIDLLSVKTEIMSQMLLIETKWLGKLWLF